MSGTAIERCAVALERAGALAALVTKHLSDEAQGSMIVSALETVSALIEDASDELRAIEAGVRHE